MPGLTEALGFSSLIAGTLEYAILLRHREERRRDIAHAELTSDLGHEALMRMSLLDRARLGAGGRASVRDTASRGSSAREELRGLTRPVAGVAAEPGDDPAAAGTRS